MRGQTKRDAKKRVERNKKSEKLLGPSGGNAKNSAKEKNSQGEIGPSLSTTQRKKGRGSTGGKTNSNNNE